MSKNGINEAIFYSEVPLTDEKNRLLCSFFEILKNKELLTKCDAIFNLLISRKKKLFLTESINETNFLPKDEEVLFISFLFLKPLNKFSNFSPENEFNFINSYDYINDVYFYIESFCIFYFHKLPLDKKKIKRYIFSFICELIENKILVKRIEKIGLKTTLEISSGIIVEKINDFDYLNICFSKPKVIEINGLKYLKGAFMSRVQEVFKQNQNSGERVILKNLSFLYSFSSLSVQINKDLFNFAEKSVEKEINLSLNEVPNAIKKEKNLFNEKIKLKIDEKKSIIEDFYKEYLNEKYTYINSCKNIELKNIPYLLFLRWVTYTLLDQKNTNNNFLIISTYLIVLNNFKQILDLITDDNLKKKMKFKFIKNFEEGENEENLKILLEESFAEDFLETFDEESMLDEIESNKNSLGQFEEKDDDGNLNKNKKKNYNKMFNAAVNDEIIDFNGSSGFLFLNKKKVQKKLKKLSKKYFEKIKKKQLDPLFDCYRSKILEIINFKKEKENFDLNNIEKSEILKILDHIGSEAIKNSWKNMDVSENLIKVAAQWDNEMNSIAMLTFSKKLYNLKKEIVLIQKEYSKISKYILYNNLNILKNNIKFEEKIFFLFFFDFRGRFYHKSPIGVTELKLSRYFYYYGEYSKTELEDNSKNKIDNIIKLYLDEIKKIKLFFKIETNSNKINHAIFWIIISISKIFIEKNSTKISRDSLIALGVKNILNNENTLKNSNGNLKLESIIEFNYGISSLKNLSNPVVKKLPIHKDATASGMQNLIRIMGNKNENSLNFCNLNDSTHWYDTYLIIREKWLEIEKKKKNYKKEDYEIFTRKTIKAIIMTKPYAATYLFSFKRFREKVFEVTNTYVELGSKEEERFKSFYKFLENDVEETFFLKNNSKNMVTYFAKEFEKDNEYNFWINSHDSSVNLVYYKFFTKTYDVLVKTPSEDKLKRKTKKWLELDKTKIDKKKIIDSIRANWIQNIDSIFIRDILKKMGTNYLAIHDCVLVDVLNVSNFIIAANEVYNVKIFNETHWNSKEDLKVFSIFIFL